jgi:hypothetical protein
MSDYSTKNIIDYAMNDDGINFRKELYSSIHDKVAAHIAAAKEVIAQNLISNEDNEEFETEQETEE